MKSSESCTVSATATESRNIRYTVPRYQITPLADSSVVRVELPGAGKENIRIAVEDNEILIEADNAVQKPDSWKVLHRESTDRSYRLGLRLGKQVDRSAISAKLEEGVLTLVAPKSEEAKSRAIKVK